MGGGDELTSVFGAQKVVICMFGRRVARRVGCSVTGTSAFGAGGGAGRGSPGRAVGRPFGAFRGGSGAQRLDGAQLGVAPQVLGREGDAAAVLVVPELPAVAALLEGARAGVRQQLQLDHLLGGP